MNEGILSELHFSHSYAEARRRFIEAARTVNASVHSYAIDATASENLTIDVAIIGADTDPALVVSSGVHGVEGFFGSAVQLALLERLANAGYRAGARFVLIHALNPYGYARLRRVNEDNVDLNRNFLSDANDYVGAPEGYARLDAFLNPPSPPSRLECFRATALWNIWRMGLSAFLQAVAQGQYEFPKGLFFGGKYASRCMHIVQDHCGTWIADAPRVMHLDLHTGLGAFGGYKLHPTASADAALVDWFAGTFGAEYVQQPSRRDLTAYTVSGEFGEWMQQHFEPLDYRFAVAEFGTYNILRVLAALRAENRAHHYCAPDSPAYLRAKEELRECFCPESPAWRHQVIDAGLRVIEQGIEALLSTK